MLSIVGQYVSKIELEKIYHAVLESNLRYGFELCNEFGTTRQKTDKDYFSFRFENLLRLCLDIRKL